MLLRKKDFIGCPHFAGRLAIHIRSVFLMVSLINLANSVVSKFIFVSLIFLFLIVQIAHGQTVTYSNTIPYGQVSVGQTKIDIVDGAGQAIVPGGTPPTLSLTATLDKSSDPSFSIVEAGCADTFERMCSVTVAFAPKSTGIFYAIVNVHVHIDASPVPGSLPLEEYDTIYLNGVGIPGVNQPVTVKAQSMRVAQSVYNPQLSTNTSSTSYDVVQGKSMSFEVSLSATNNQSSADKVTVQVVDSAGNVLSQSRNPIPISAITSGFRVPASAMTSFVPAVTGVLPITVRFDTSSAPNTKAVPLMGYALNVLKTYAPSVGLIRFGDCTGVHTCYGSTNPGNFANLLLEQSFVSDIFPVADNSLKFSTISSNFYGTPDKTKTTQDIDRGMADDIRALAFKKNTLGVSRLVGIVPAGYFKYHNLLTNTGMTAKTILQVQLVSETGIESLPHELGHGLGVFYEYYDKVTRLYNGPFEDGFNARSNVEIPKARSIMGPDDGTLSGIWIDTQTYLTTFKTLLTPTPDPDVILVSGLLSDTGIFTFGPSKRLPQGELTQSNLGGDIKVSTLDINNVEINSVVLQSDFGALISYPEGYSGSLTPTMGAIPIVVALPNSPNINTIQISLNAKPIAKTSVNAQLLLDIIESIPDNAFKLNELFEKNDHDEDMGNSINKIYKIKNHLAKEAEEIQKILNSKRPEKATYKLGELTEEIEHKTYLNYTVIDATQTTRQQVISEIEAIIKSISSDHHRDHDDDNREKK